VWGVRKGGSGGWGSFWVGGPKFTRDWRGTFFAPPDAGIQFVFAIKLTTVRVLAS
jgi:hypothetical protein